MQFKPAWCSFAGQYGQYGTETDCYLDEAFCGAGGTSCWVTCNIGGTVGCDGFCWH
jgi:hypothetical protein